MDQSEREGKNSDWEEEARGGKGGKASTGKFLGRDLGTPVSSGPSRHPIPALAHRPSVVNLEF